MWMTALSHLCVRVRACACVCVIFLSGRSGVTELFEAEKQTVGKLGLFVFVFFKDEF